MTGYSLTFRSDLAAAPADVWAGISSIAGISRETLPYLRLSVPAGIERLDQAYRAPGQRLFRSWLLLFGIVPVDFTDLTLTALDPGRGFVEQSRMGSMRSWRHERRIVPTDEGCAIVDTLHFEPRSLPKMTIWFVSRFFAHRHRRLRHHFGEPTTTNGV